MLDVNDTRQRGIPFQRPNSKFLAGERSRLWHRVNVDSGIGLPMVKVSESTQGEVIVNSCIGSNSPCFSLDSAPENIRLLLTYRKKNVRDIPVPGLDVTYQTLHGQE
jgi:hypothetical protein